MGAFVADLHRDHGVDVRLGVGVLGVDGGTRVERVRLTDGTVDDVDFVVIGIGVSPNTEWLAGSGLDIDRRRCLRRDLPRRTRRRGRGRRGALAECPVRRGDARRALGQRPRDGRPRRPHDARRTSRPARRTAPIPWFWSDQYDRKIQLAGRAGPDDEVEIVEGSLEEQRFTALFGRRGRLIGVLGVNRPAQVARWRAQIESGTSWDDALAAARTVEPLG